MQGKLIEIHFGAMGKICGAKVQTCKHVQAIYVTANVLCCNIHFYCNYGIDLFLWLCVCLMPTRMLT